MKGYSDNELREVFGACELWEARKNTLEILQTKEAQLIQKVYNELFPEWKTAHPALGDSVFIHYNDMLSVRDIIVKEMAERFYKLVN
jgi:hypothetical protein